MSFEYVLPVAPAAPESAAKTGKQHVWNRLPAKPVLGLIDNGKTRAHDLLVGLGRALEKRGLIASHFVLRKPTAAHTITEQNRVDLRARAHVIVSGIGD